jgi:hypothetical protein
LKSPAYAATARPEKRIIEIRKLSATFGAVRTNPPEKTGKSSLQYRIIRFKSLEKSAKTTLSAMDRI